MLRYLSAALAVALATSFGVAAAEDVFKKTENGTPKIESISAIAFGPNGALLIGDSKGGQIVAIDTKDTKAKAWKAAAIEKVDEKIAAKLGTKASNIEIVSMAVNRASGTAYLVVRKQDEKKSLIVTVDGDGKIGELSLEKVDYVAVPLPKGDKVAVTITDVAVAKDRILVGALAKEEFASKVYSIPAPLDSAKKGTGFSTETYHVAHGKWETRAPMTTLIPMEQNGKKYVVGAFACTPVVRYPLDDVKQDAKVKGTSAIELGHGNRPRHMFAYTKGDKGYLLIANHRMDRMHKSTPVGPSPYWVAKVDMAVFDETEKVNEKAPWRVQKGTAKPLDQKLATVAEAYHGTIHLDKLSDKQALVIKEDKKTGLTLTALDLP
jgi:hypothetical protein